MKAFLRIVFLLLAAIAIFVATSNLWVVLDSKKSLYTDVEEIPSKNIALVLGTSRLNSAGQKNEYFENRIDAVALLYHHGKVKHIIVSGDNQTIYYNEPRDMQRSLVAKGIPAKAITMDYAGLRTLDSVIRCKEIFGQDDVIIVTQKFHAYRALFIADHYDFDAVGYSAESPSVFRNRVFLREVGARAFAVLDLYVFKTKPKYLGDKIELSF